jgi:hypothetical protein
MPLIINGVMEVIMIMAELTQLTVLRYPPLRIVVSQVPVAAD